MIGKVIDTLKNGTFIESAKVHLAEKFMPIGYRITYDMQFIDGVRPHIQSYDYVRVSVLELVANEINENNIEGDCAELGVFKGDFAKYISALFPKKKLYLFDTFEGFSSEDVGVDVKKGYSTGKQDFSDTSIREVLRKMPNRENCVIRKGWFPKTTEGLESQKYAFVSIDADLYEPIYQGLTYFYPRLTCGGVILIHDYNNKQYKGVKHAVRNYSKEHGVPFMCLPDICGSAVMLK